MPIRRYIALVAVSGAAIGCASLGARAPAARKLPVQPVVEVRTKPILQIDGLRFRDLNGNGRLDVYEDWRAPVDARVSNLLGQMTLAEKAGLMLIDTLNAGCDGSVPANAPDLLARQNMRRFILRNPITIVPKCVSGSDWRSAPSITPAQTAEFTNNIQAMAEGGRLGIPVMFKSNPRNHLDGVTRQGINEASGAFTAFPREPGIAAAALGHGTGRRGDMALVRAFGRVVGKEWRATGIRGMYGYQADLGTEPRWHRFPQVFTEDADLDADIMTALVASIQGGPLNPSSPVELTIKHFPGGGPQEFGLDPHYSFGKNQVYPARRFSDHLKPFQAAIAAGAGAIMPYYGVPIDVTYDGVRYKQVGMAFSRQIVTDLLRQKLGFAGYVNSDTGIVADRAWGLENRTVPERITAAIDSGTDILSGFHDVKTITDLVDSGKLTTARIDESARRLLAPMFRQGLFEDPYTNVSAAAATLSDPAHKTLALEIQRESIVLLQNDRAILPIRPGARLYSLGGPAAALSGRGYVVTDGDAEDARPSAAGADLAIIRVDISTVNVADYRSDDPASGMNPAHLNPRTQKPWGAEDRCVATGQKPCLDNALPFGGALPWEAGFLSFSKMATARSWKVTPSLETIQAVMKEAGPGRTVLVIEFRQPYVLDAESHLRDAGAILATFGVGDEALTDILTGRSRPIGRMPFALAKTLDAVIRNDPDAPGYPVSDTLFPMGFGLRYPR